MFTPTLSSEYGLALSAGLPWDPYLKRTSATTALNPTEENFQKEWAVTDRDLVGDGNRASPQRCILDLEKVNAPWDDGSGGRFWLSAGMIGTDPQVIACNKAVADIVRSFKARYPDTLLSFWGGPLLELTSLCSAMLDAADFAAHSIGSSWLKSWRDVQRMVRTYQQCYASWGFGPSRILLCVQALGDDRKPRPGHWLQDAAQIIRDGGHSLMLTWPSNHNPAIDEGRRVVDSIRGLFK